MADLFSKIKIGNPSSVEGILSEKVQEAIATKANVLWAIGINKKGYEEVSILVIVNAKTDKSVLDKKYSLKEKNGRHFYMTTIMEGVVDIVEVK